MSEPSDVHVRLMRPEERLVVARALGEIEREVEYPLGTDRFRIVHGRGRPERYFAFFERLGTLRVHAAWDRNGEVLGALVLIDRRNLGEGTEPCSYACDLKLRVGAAQRGLGLQLLAHARAATGTHVRGYAVSMNPPGQPSRSPLGRLARRALGDVDLDATPLCIHELDVDEARALAPAIRALRGSCEFVDTTALKAIYLASTGRPMPLLHVRFGPDPTLPTIAPRDGHVHMVCTPRGDALDETLRDHTGRGPSARATVLSVGMTDAARYVTTDEI